MTGIREYIEQHDRFAALVGIEVLEVSPGHARARLAIRDDHLNALGSAHGAAIFSLADLVFQAASNSHGTIAMAINVSISFLKAARGGTLVAEGHEVSLNAKLASYRVDVVDDDGDTVAILQGMVYRKSDPLPN